MSSETKAAAKKLFALSGNCCAFPKCEQRLVIKHEILIGEVCHIEGENPESARYNKDQTNVEKNHNDNLIVLCPTHHTLIDRDPVTYTVEKIKQMKNDHENKFLGHIFEVSDKVIDQAINFTQNINAHGMTPIITQTGNYPVVNVYGELNPKQVKETFEFLFKENYPKIQKIATQEVEQRLSKFTNMFLEMANGELTERDIYKFTDPDIQFILTNALITNARYDSQKLRENLSKLIIKRIKSDENLEKIVLDEAIKTIGKLTPNQIDILTLCFLLKYIQSGDVYDWQSFNEWLKRDVDKLLSEYDNDDIDFQHLLYTKCITNLTCCKDILYHIQKSYPFLFSEHLTKEQIEGLDISEEIIGDLFSYSKVTNKYYFNIIDPDKLTDELFNYELYLDKMKIIEKLHKSCVFDINKTFDEMDKNTDIGAYLFFENCCGFIDDIELTSVGIAIAVIRLEEISNCKINLQSWISKVKFEN